MPRTMLSENMEDYLEAIFYLKNANGIVRVRDIAERIDVKMPSVSDALKSLSKRKLVRHESYGYVELTEKGEQLAREMLGRHHQLCHFLKNVLGVNAETAEQDACRIEHVVSPQTMERLLTLIQAMEACGSGNCDMRTLHAMKSAPAAETNGIEAGQPTLRGMKKGQKAYITGVSPHARLRGRLLDMGFTMGEQVEMLSEPTESGRVDARIKGYKITLDQREAALVKVAVK